MLLPKPEGFLTSADSRCRSLPRERMVPMTIRQLPEVKLEGKAAQLKKSTAGPIQK
jgi:hypothetical protein